MRAAGATRPGPPPRSVSGRFAHSPLWRVLGALADAGVTALDATAGLQRRLDRNRRVLPVDANRITVRVAERRIVAEDQDVVALTLTAPAGGLPAWHPGAHIDVFLPSGRNRQYSLCGDPGDSDRYRIAVRRIPAGDGGSLEMHALAVGDTLTISIPRNAFFLAPPGAGSTRRRLRFIAGGIGITPILPMVAHAERLGVDWQLIYTGRHRRSQAFLDELAGYGGRVVVRTDDEHGLPTAAVLLDGVDADTAVYVCGPPAMVAEIRTGLADHPGAELHAERFSPPPVTGGRPFTIELARTGGTVTVGADETALAAVLRHRPDVAYSCRQGFCGTCVQQVTDGAVEHRDNLLTDGRRGCGQMLICVSRADGDRLTLDL